jgi:predicted dehydrogenase
VDSRYRGFSKVQVWDSDHPYMKNWWVPGCSIGYEHSFIHVVSDFLSGLESGEKRCPDFDDAYRCQLVCDAVLESAKTGTWTRP